MKRSDLVVGQDYLVNRHQGWLTSREFVRRRVLATSGWVGAFGWPKVHTLPDGLSVYGEVDRALGWSGHPLMARVRTDGSLVEAPGGATTVEAVPPVAIRGPWTETLDQVLVNIRSARARMEESVVNNRLAVERRGRVIDSINSALPGHLEPAAPSPDPHLIVLPLGTAEWLVGRIDALASQAPQT